MPWHFLQLEKKVYSNPKFVEIIEQSQQKILDSFLFSIITIYTQASLPTSHKPIVDTAGQINPRIMVRGNAEAFKDSSHTNRIRASLFTGLQMAHLWRQLGGSSWGMVFSKRKLLTRYSRSRSFTVSGDLTHDATGFLVLRLIPKFKESL